MMTSPVSSSVRRAGDRISAEVPYDCPRALTDRWQLDVLVAKSRRSWVYRGHDTQLSSDDKPAVVAIKISRLVGASDEARLGRRIEHEAVVKVFDRGVTSLGHAFVVTEWIEGRTLTEISEPWPARRAAAFVEELARAIQAAHSAGVVHCDLKPDNVLLTASGQPRLIDFDLATGQNAVDTADGRGNLAFMSPEQFRSEMGALSPQADIYALGGLLHQLVLAEPPHGRDAEIIAISHADGIVPTFAGAPRTLAAIGRRAMDPDRSRRYPTAQQLADDLRSWLDGRPIAWMRPSPVQVVWLWARRNPVWAMAVVFGVAGLISAVGVHEWFEHLDRERQALSNAEVVERTRSQINLWRRAEREELLLKLDRLAKQDTPSAEKTLHMALALEWIGATPDLDEVVGEDFAPTARLEAWRRAVDAIDRKQQTDTVVGVMARTALCMRLLENGQHAQALDEIGIVTQASVSVYGKLPEDDPVKLAVDAVELVARLRINRERNGRADLSAAYQLNGRLRQAGVPRGVIQLVESELRSHGPQPKNGQ